MMPAGTSRSLEELVAIYRKMVRIRNFEDRAVELFGKGMITGSTHPCIAQEAISVGACAALEPQDLVLATYRGHGAALAKGSDPGRVMAELLTRTTGCCKGRGGQTLAVFLAPYLRDPPTSGAEYA